MISTFKDSGDELKFTLMCKLEGFKALLEYNVFQDILKPDKWVVYDTTRLKKVEIDSEKGDPPYIFFNKDCYATID